MVSRLDLDGVQAPMALVSKILKAEPNLKIPVPIEELAGQLDIEDIKPLRTEGFLGGLVTNEARSNGFILVKKGLGSGRHRFTVAHELGHFLNPFHKLSTEDGFLCDRAAMKRWDLKAQNAAWRMEAEANKFASLILMPPPKLRDLLKQRRFASIQTVLDLHNQFDVSKEAAARAYAEYNPEVVAILVAHHGKFKYAYRQREFPRLDLRGGQPIPEISRLHLNLEQGKYTDSDPTDAAHWIDERDVKSVNALYEQVLPQAKRFAMIQLKALIRDDDEYDPEEDLTSKQRFARRLDRRN